MESTTPTDVRDRWLRSELALTAGRGALIGWGIYRLISFLQGEPNAFTLGTIALLLLPFTILYLAGSQKFLAWLRSAAGEHVPALKTTWMDEGRLFLRCLSGRTMLTLVVLALLFVFFIGGAPEAYGRDAVDPIDNMLLAGITTYFWAVGMRKGKWGAARYGIAAAVIYKMLFIFFGVRILTGSTSMWDMVSGAGMQFPAGLLLALALRPALFAFAGAYAMENLRSAASFPVRIVGSLLLAVILSQALTRWITIDLLSSFVFALGWGVALALSKTAEPLLTPEIPASDVVPSAAAGV